ncbi:cell division protease FtsH [Sinorhizobium fredii]|uniref:AAA family ATPase n=1 Tax=Rhizobium fredii TaxID=380 RepID=UPI003517C26D
MVLLRAPKDYDVSDYATAALRVLIPNDDYVNQRHGFMIIDEAKTEKKAISEYWTECADKDRAIIIAAEAAQIPSIIKIAADVAIDLACISALDFRIACRSVNRVRFSNQEAEQLLTFSDDYIWTAVRRGRTFADTLQRLRDAEPETQVSPSVRPGREVPKLSDMFGYGNAKQWGLELATDLADWRKGLINWADVDTGIVLSGPPGVGKTIFARSLAAECGVSLISGSLGQWQAKGHLGDLLKAMRAAFQRAKDQVPSILFIDELDSMGDREKFEHENSSYSVQVVNAFLECLDGVDGREGVIVVGATNNVSRIDAAILRPGRLDRHIEIPLPDGNDRIAILSQHIDHSLPLPELAQLKSVTQGMAGADLSKVARDARRLARRQRMGLHLDHLKASLPETIKITGAYRRSIAIHEAGHTVIGIRLGHGTFVGTKIADSVIPGAGAKTGGMAHFDLPVAGHRDRHFYLNYLALLMGGIAAEELVTGSFGDGASSDLAIATRVATMIETRFGFGRAMLYSHAEEDKELERLRLADPRLRAKVEQTLQEAFDRAKSVLSDERKLLDKIAEELNEVGHLFPARLAELHATEAPKHTEADLRVKEQGVLAQRPMSQSLGRFGDQM